MTSLTSCRQPPLVGKYIGTYRDFRTEKPGSTELQPNKSNLDTFWIEISTPAKNSPNKIIEFDSVFKSVLKNEAPPITLQAMTLAPESGTFQSFKNGFSLTVQQLSDPVSPRTAPDPTVFHLIKTEQTPSQKITGTLCYLGYDSAQLFRAVICINDGDLSIDIKKKDSPDPLIKITGSRFLGTDEKAKFEEPHEFTLNEAVKTALKQATELLVEDQIVFQAWRSSSASRYALLPHIGFGTSGLPASLGDPRTLVSFLGDLAPFIFPAHWIRAEQGPLRVKIELDAARIIKLNLVNRVQELAYLYNRDLTTYQQREKIINRWHDQIMPTMREMEGKGHVLPNSTEALDNAYREASEDLKELYNLIQEDLYALSLALGFLNPLTVSGLDLGNEEDPIDTAVGCDNPQELGEQGFRVSIERRQIENAKLLAHQESKELYYNWFDPDGSSSTALGGGLIERIGIAESKIHELELRELLIQKSVFNSSSLVCNDYNRSLNSYRRQIGIRVLSGNLFEEQVEGLVNARAQDRDFGTAALVFAEYFNNLLKSMEGLAGAIGNYRIHRTQLQRILLTGHFREALKPDRGEIPDLRLLGTLPLGLRD